MSNALFLVIPIDEHIIEAVAYNFFATISTLPSIRKRVHDNTFEFGIGKQAGEYCRY